MGLAFCMPIANLRFPSGAGLQACVVACLSDLSSTKQNKWWTIPVLQFTLSGSCQTGTFCTDCGNNPVELKTNVQLLKSTWKVLFYGSHTVKWDNPTIRAGTLEHSYEPAFHWRWRSSSYVSNGGFCCFIQAQSGCPRRCPVLRLKPIQKQIKRPHENQMYSRRTSNICSLNPAGMKFQVSFPFITLPVACAHTLWVGLNPVKLLLECESSERTD